MWYIYATPSYLYFCKQLWINWFIYVHQNCVRCNRLWCFGNTEIQSVVDSPHKRPLNLCLDVFFVVSLSKLLKQQSICWCWKTSSCVISNMFSLKFKVRPQSSTTFLREISYDNNLIKFFATIESFIIKFAGKIFQDVIISVFSKNVCTQICYNGRGGANSVVLISLPHKPCDLFWLCPVDCSVVPLVRHLVDVSCYVAKPLGMWNRLIARGIDLLPPKYSTNMQILTFQLSEKWFITGITAMLITRWHK